MTEIENNERELESKIEEYLEYAGQLETGSELKELLKEEKYDVLKDMLLKRLEFGTAGIRGKMGTGFGYLNDLVVIQTAQGIVEYLQNISADSDKKKEIVIGFDNRHHSERFAQLIAVSFLNKGFKVNIFSTIVPTPFIPFSIVKLKCLIGIMVTASHNPKEYNGIKVYWSNGAQILSEHAKGIQEKIIENLKPWPDSSEVSRVWTSPLAFDPMADVVKMYFDEVKSYSFFQDKRQTGWKSLKIAFTSLHGVSHFFLKRGFQTLNFNEFFPVEEQMRPDPDFSTVEFPNPEEDKTFEYAISTAEDHECQLIFAVDPDADRFRMAEKVTRGRWHLFTGNEIAALLASFLWDMDPERKVDPTKFCMISSAVSSKILRSMAAKEGFKFYETLTGFKWIANTALDCMSKGNEFLFGFEEAIGFMCGPMVMDKDGLLTAFHVLVMAGHVCDDEKGFYDLLGDLYLKYGFHYSRNSYFICDNHEAIKSMFHGLRNFEGVSGKYPDKLEDGDDSFKVLRVRDVTTGYDSQFEDKKGTLPKSPSMEMITFFFKNIEVTIRVSGTEPKLKYYSEIIKAAPKEDWHSLKMLLIKVVNLVIEKWIQPSENDFEYPQVTD